MLATPDTWSAPPWTKWTWCRVMTPPLDKLSTQITRALRIKSIKLSLTRRLSEIGREMLERKAMIPIIRSYSCHPWSRRHKIGLIGLIVYQALQVLFMEASRISTTLTMDICCHSPLEDRTQVLLPKQPLMPRCRDNQSTRVSLIETDKWFQDHPSTIKARQETKFSADFQIFSYRIRLQIKTKRYQDKVVELSNQ